MSFLKLILRSLWFYRKQHVSIFAGIVISIAVLTGALLTGESVQTSLERLTSVRLGNIRFSMSTEVLFRDQLATEMNNESNCISAAVLQTKGITISNENNLRINRSEIYGIDSVFLKFWGNTEDLPIEVPEENEAVISENTSQKLKVKVGDEILLRINKISGGNSNAPFASEMTPAVPVRVKVKGIITANSMGRFSLKASQTAPYNIFLSKTFLQRILSSEKKSNLLLLSECDNPEKLLKSAWKTEDAGINFKTSGQITEITSEKLFISDTSAHILSSNAKDGTLFLSYLVNKISKNDSSSTPYSFVVATDQEINGEKISEDEIVVNSWLADDLTLHKGDKVKLVYFTMQQGMDLHQDSAFFHIKSIIDIKNTVWDASLMPAFPGISDALSCSDWESGTPVDLKKIRKKDENYWKQYKGTPKAFISLDAGKKIWNNPFGTATAIRFPSAGNDRKQIEDAYTLGIDPASTGMIFQPVYNIGQKAAFNATDFGGLFLGLGFFIIFSGILLASMLVSHHLSGRMKEFETLSSLGFTWKKIFYFALLEISLILLLAGIAGPALGVLYTSLVINGLNTLWIPATGTSDLSIHISWSSMLAGSFAGIIISTIVIFFIIRKKIYYPDKSKRKLQSDKYSVRGVKIPDTFSLIIRWVQINPWRNAGIIALLAVGTMVIIITGVFYKNPQNQNNHITSGTGGFMLFAETTVPLPHSLGKQISDIKVEDSTFNNVRILPLIKLEENDASCLNLNQVPDPSLIGVPKNSFAGRFSFKNILDEVSEPWRILDNEFSSGIIPGFADQSVLQWGLGKKTGDTIFYIDESGKTLGVRIMGALESSIFQGNILISDSLLRKYFPSSFKTTILLLDGSKKDQDHIVMLLEQLFTDYGMTVTPAAGRLAEFETVQNTYLSVFLLLGGLGIVIATFGLGVFFIRELSSKQKELALYSSLGFSFQKTFFIASGGYIFMLCMGILSGIFIAIGALFCFFTAPSGVTWLVVALLSAILCNGMLWIYVSFHITIKKNLIDSLRLE